MSERLRFLLKGFVPQVGNENHIIALKKLHEYQLIEKKVKKTKPQREKMEELDAKMVYLLGQPLI